MRFAYADPPYIGQAKRHYGAEAERDGREAKEVNHALLVAHLCEFDAWALSLSAPTLRVILPMCPTTARVGAWVKPFAAFKKGVNPAYCWEPVIFDGARTHAQRGGSDALTVRDWVSANITMGRTVNGAKPNAFCHWLFESLGAKAGDEFHDLFPGSGAVTRAWTEWSWHNAA